MSDTTPNGPDNVVLDILRAIRVDQATHSRCLEELRIEVRDGFHDLRERLSALEQAKDRG